MCDWNPDMPMNCLYLYVNEGACLLFMRAMLIRHGPMLQYLSQLVSKHIFFLSINEMLLLFFFFFTEHFHI